MYLAFIIAGVMALIALVVLAFSIWAQFGLVVFRAWKRIRFGILDLLLAMFVCGCALAALRLTGHSPTVVITLLFLCFSAPLVFLIRVTIHDAAVARQQQEQRRQLQAAARFELPDEVVEPTAEPGVRERLMAKKSPPPTPRLSHFSLMGRPLRRDDS